MSPLSPHPPAADDEQGGRSTVLLPAEAGSLQRAPNPHPHRSLGRI